MIETIGRLFASLDGAFRGAVRGLRDGIGGLRGPLQSLAFVLVLGLTGLRLLVGDAFRLADRVVGALERAAVFLGLLGMTLLAFNEYLQRELRPALGTDLGGLWAIEGQMNVALLLLIVVGFLGASLATRDDKHIAVDAMERVLSPGPARLVKRLVAITAGGLCLLLARGAMDAVFTSSKDTFEGVKVWSWMVGPVNALSALMPGEHYGPGTPFTSLTAWEDAQYDLDKDPFELPAFAYVQAGDGFPLWIPLLLLVVIFSIMALRFAARAVSLPPPATLPGPQAPVVYTRKPADVILAGAFPGALLAMGLGVWWGTAPLLILGSLLLLLLGAPLFVGIGVGTLGAWVLLRDGSAEGVISDMFEATKKQELLAIPFFVLAGNLMTEGSIARRLIEIAKVSLGSLPGGLGVGAVMACAFFAAISGSSPVTVIAIGSIVFPMLVAEGYSERYSIGVLTTAGSLGIIIPPSVPMLIYAIIVSGNPDVGVVDPTVLFKAGILPGLFIALVLVLWTFYTTWPRPGQAEAAVGRAVDIPEGSSWARELGLALVRGIPSLLLPVLVLGGIYGWVDLRPLGLDFHISFTITEAAAVAVVYALAVELLVNRELKLREIPRVFAESAVMMGSLFLVIVIAISLNRFFVFEQVPEAATAWMLDHVDSKLGFLLAVNLFLLALGCVMDIISAILIVAPLLAPIAASYGIHPIHFAIMFIVNLELGYLTPPLGINLFVATTVFERPLLDVVRSVVPFLALMLFCLAVIVLFPSLSLLLVGGTP
ncbi:MAG: TRAP transporter large permease subunit [Alphaproteobacteria bacterium]|nr:TRAP transporter large permease subunit [Alphaproteobacteria bacterium]